MSKGVTGLLIPIDWIEDWKEDFTDEQVGIIVRALADYQTTGMMYSGEDKMIKIVIKNCYRVIDNNLGKYEQKAKRKSADERLEILSYYFENKEKENFSFQYIAYIQILLFFCLCSFALNTQNNYPHIFVLCHLQTL